VVNRGTTIGIGIPAGQYPTLVGAARHDQSDELRQVAV